MNRQVKQIQDQIAKEQAAVTAATAAGYTGANINTPIQQDANGNNVLNFISPSNGGLAFTGNITTPSAKFNNLYSTTTNTNNLYVNGPIILQKDAKCNDFLQIKNGNDTNYFSPSFSFGNPDSNTTFLNINKPPPTVPNAVNTLLLYVPLVVKNSLTVTGSIYFTELLPPNGTSSIGSVFSNMNTDKPNVCTINP